MTNYNTLKNSIIIILILFINGCSPINIFTRVKKNPNIAYSDREKNIDTPLAEPFFIIGKKDQYLKLIKYNPEHIKHNRFLERKQAKYIGWIHRSCLILPDNLNNAKKMGKMLTIISDTAVILHPERYFHVADTLKLFGDPSLSKQTATVGLYQTVYILKTSEDGKNALISSTPELSLTKADKQIIGWIPTILLQNIDELNSENGKFIHILDKNDNTIYNIDKDSISYQRGEQIKAELKRINIIFSIEASSRLAEQYPQLVNTIQNLQPLFTPSDTNFEYKFGASIALDSTNINIPLTPNFTIIPDSITTLYPDIIKKYKAKSPPWQALENTITMLQSEIPATNIIVIIGETSDNNKKIKNSIIENLKQLDCRILGAQLYASTENISTNFILQLTSMIEECANHKTKQKRSITIFPNQICKENRFKEMGKNIYILDYPHRSATQGAVLFPEKGQLLTLELLPKTIDSILTQVRIDNKILCSNIDHAFATFGNTKDKYNNYIIKHFSPQLTQKSITQFKKIYKGKNPLLYIKNKF